MSGSFVDDVPFTDDLAAPVRTPQRNTWNPLGLAKQGFAGALQVPLDVGLGIPALLGSDYAARNYRLGVDAINNFVGVQDPQWNEDTTGFAAREVGSALVGLPVSAMRRGYQLMSTAPTALQVGLRGLEAVTPLTLPLTRGNIAANAVGGMVVGAGMQELVGTEQAARDAEIRQQAEAASRQLYSGEVAQAPAVVDDAPQFVDDTARTWQGRVAPYVAPVAIGLGASGAAALAYRGIRNEQQLRAAQDAQGIVQPGLDPNSTVQRPTFTEGLAQSFVDDATMYQRGIDQLVERNVVAPDEAAELRAYARTRYTESVRNDTINEALDNGVLPLTGGRFMSAQEIEIPYRNLSATDRAEFDALMVAANELDNREFNRTKKSFATYNGVQGPARVNLWDKDDVALGDIVQRASQNPRLQEVINAYRADADAQLDFMVAAGLKTQEDVNKMREVHPNYMFTMYNRDRLGVSGDRGIMHTTESNTPTSARTYTDQAGGFRGQSPIVARNEAWRKLMSEALVNDAMVKLARASDKLQSTLSPMDKRVFGRVINTRAPARDGFAAVRFTEQGKDKQLEMSAEALELVGSVPRASAGILSAFSNAYRALTTGAWGALLGSFMAPVSAGMASGAIAVNRPRGSRAGIFDAALRKVTGDRVGLPGDVSFLFQTAGQAVADLTAQSNQWLYQAIQRSHMNNGTLAKWLGPQGSVDLMRWSQRYYDTSNLAATRRAGASGTGLGYDPAVQYTLQPGLQLRTPEARQKALMPDANQLRSSQDLINYVQQGFNKYISPTQAQRVWGMWTQALDIISGSATSAYFRLNRGRGGATDEVIAAEARSLAGDPSAMGTNKLWQQAMSATPYANITIQSITSAARAAKSDPAQFIPGLIIATTTIPLIQVASAIYADMVEQENNRPPKYVAHMLMQNANQTTTDMRVYVPGIEPQFGFRMTPDYTVAPFTAVAQYLVIKALGADRPEFWSPEMAGLREGFVDFITDRSATAVWESINTAYGQFAVNPLIAAGVQATTGANIQNSLSAIAPRISMPRDVGMPGYEDRQGSNDPVPRVIRDIITNVTGASAETMLSAITTGAIAALAEGGEPVAAAVDDMTIRATGNLRQVAPLFQQQRRLTQRDAVGDIMAGKESRLQEIAAGRRDMTAPDTVGAGRATQLATGVGRQPPPEDIAPYLLEAGAFYATGSMRQLRERRSALQQDILSIENDPAQANNPQARLQVINERVRSIRELNQMMYTEMQALEADMSRRSGRRIRFERMDPQRGLDQFPSLY